VRHQAEDHASQPEIAIILLIFLVFELLEITFTRFFSKPGQTTDGAIVEIVSTLSLVLVSQPFALAGGAFLASLAAPGAAMANSAMTLRGSTRGTTAICFSSGTSSSVQRV
jgi:hypothetical protein